MRRDNRLSRTQILLWSTFGVGTGLLAGFALSEWVGGVNQTRVRRVAQGLGLPSAHHTSAASARAVEAALRSRAASGWLRSRGSTDQPQQRRAPRLGRRPSRPHPGRPGGMRGVSGVETVINSILVRGEDDRVIPGGKRVNDQSA